MSFFSMLTAFLTVLHVYIFWRIFATFGLGIWQLPLLLLFGGMLYLISSRNALFSQNISLPLYWAVYLWVGFIVIAALSFVLVDVTKLALFVAGKVSGIQLSALIPARRGGFLAIGLSLGLTCFAYWQALNIRPVYLTIPSAKISQETGRLRIAAVSDIHLGPIMDHGRLKRVTDVIRDVKPDILVFVGDIVDTDMSHRGQDAALIKSVIPHGGGFAVLGNHELYRGMDQAIAFLELAGLKVLRNASAEALNIIIAGVDDPVFKHDPDLEREAAFLRGLDQARFTLFLRHRPGYQRQLAGWYDLQVSGHTHGGQIWPGRILASHVNGIGQGLSTVTGDSGQSLLYVLNGAGFWGPPMRLGSPPEVLVIDLIPLSK